MLPIDLFLRKFLGEFEPTVERIWPGLIAVLGDLKLNPVHGYNKLVVFFLTGKIILLVFE